LIPAIDLLDGAVVRLFQGDFDRVTRYGDDPVAIAREWALAGAKSLHVVDLEGSRSGEPKEAELVSDLFERTRLPIQVAGGIRSLDGAKRWLDAGASAVVIGSLAVKDPDAVGKIVEAFGEEKVVAAVDARVDADGASRVAVSGWTEDGGVSVEQALEALSERGVRRALCTDIGRDGTKDGPNDALYRSLKERFPGLEIQASGGVGSLEDLRKLKATGVSGAVVGRALLDGIFTIDEALGV
jgi:phosphoribosylformimino-5-aminoimidazole carboxamide ribotide isomerase